MEQLKSLFKGGNSFLKRRALRRSLTREKQVFYRLFGVRRSTVVVREHIDPIIDTIAISRFDGRRHAFVEGLAPVSQDGVVSDLAGKRVLESVLDVAHRSLFIDKLGKL